MLSGDDAHMTVPVAVCMRKTPKSESVIVDKETELPETNSREQTGITAKCVAAAADLERVAGQHGDTLVQLGLVLRPD
jgi:hypothetical protein